jgi:alpha-ribazole phosphatase
MMVASLFLLRHGKTTLAGKMVGSTDVDLAAEGKKQIRSLKGRVQAEKFDRIFCSTMRRCRQTAELLALETEITYDKDLKEIDFGVWEGMDFSEIEQNYREHVQRWVEDPESFCFPAGECRKDFITRLENFKNKLISLKEEKVLIITHGGVIRHLICSFLGLSADSYLLFQVSEGLLTSLACFGDRGILTGLNLKEAG